MKKSVFSGLYRWIAERLPNRLVYFAAVRALTYRGAPDNSEAVQQLQAWCR